jgi:Flp pilus assembly protein TadG
MRLSLSKRTPNRRRTRGQSLAEFAIVFPVFMLVVGGIIQFGIIFWGQNTLNQIVRDAGRYAVTERTCDATSQADVSAKIDSVASNASFAGTIGTKTLVMPTTTAPDPISDPCPPDSNAKQVWLRITVEAQVPVFFPFIPGNGHLSSTALFRMEPVTPP